MVRENDWKNFEDGVLIWQDHYTDTFRCTESNQEAAYQYEVLSLGWTEICTFPFSYNAGVFFFDGDAYSKESSDSSLGYYDITTDGVLTVKADIGLPSAVIIPTSVNGIEVKTIGVNAFGGHKEIKSVVIPDTVKSIKGSAFSRCSNLGSITIPSSVTSIDTYSAFADCNRLTVISVDPKNTRYSAENGILYDTTKTTLYAWPSANGEVVIPDSVTSISRYAFSHNNSVTQFLIPATVSYIGEDVFPSSYDKKNYSIIVSPDSPYYCMTGNTLYSKDGKTIVFCLYAEGALVVPDSVEKIESFSYAYTDITSVVIPSSVSSTGQNVFLGCKNLTEVIILNPDVSLGAFVFQNCSGLETINYSGTTAQWNAMQRGNRWNVRMPACTVHCTDGDVVVEPIE